jgi:xylan 1,4-beta-xylosidase
MPQALSSHPTPYRNTNAFLLNGGCFYPPTDYAKWGDLVRAWAAHADGRYPNVAAGWLWELWNEPESAYWHGTFDEYAKLYDYTEAALHEVLPNAPLGGPAVVNLGDTFLTQFLQHCAADTNNVTGQTGTRLDLVTFHAKGGVAVVGDHVEMNLGNQLRLHRDGFSAVAAFSQFKQKPIYITEADPDGCAACSTSTEPADAYRNSTAYGAYEVAMMKHTLDLEAQLGVKLGGVLTWAFTFPGTPYFAGYRALATNGINLPVLSAFKLLGRLAGNRLPVTSSGARPLDDLLANGVRSAPDIDGLASIDGAAIQVVVWNYHDDVVAVPATPVRLAIKVPSSFGAVARVSHLRVDEAHGDAYSVWGSQGMPASPSAEQLAALEQAMEPSSLMPDRTVGVSRGIVALDFDLPRFGISLVTIQPGAADGGALPPPDQPRGGCTCRVSGRQDAAADGAAQLVMALLGLVAVRRRERPSNSREWRTAGGATRSTRHPDARR